MLNTVLLTVPMSILFMTGWFVYCVYNMYYYGRPGDDDRGDANNDTHGATVSTSGPLYKKSPSGVYYHFFLDP
jgi:hypothetical protein